MEKSYEEFLLGAYDAMFSDVASWYLQGAADWRRTQARLHYLVKTRGIRFLTVDLVAAGKHLDQCLSAGSFTPSRLPGQGSRKGWVIPELFQGILRRVFSAKSGKLRIDFDPLAIVTLRQLYLAAKKVRMVCDDSATYKTVGEFFEVEKTIRSPTLDWADDCIAPPDFDFGCVNLAHPDRVGGSTEGQLCFDSAVLDAPDTSSGAIGVANVATIPGLLATIQRVADVVAVELGSFDSSLIQPKHGPGAVSDQARESKYDFPYWPKKLDNLFPSEDWAFYNASSVWTDIADGAPLLSKGEPPSRLIAVPKTQKAPRLIAAEPTAHQWIQQGILSLLLDRMDRTCLRNCISIRDQSPSRDMALQASVHGLWSTIDLSSASDRVSCWMVERLFRRNPEWLTAFHACRTRWIANTVDKKQPKFHKLRKFSTMGSALTFPVQSIAYALAGIGVDIWYRNSILVDGRREPRVDLSRIAPREFRALLNASSRRIRVFGDDIIHPVESTTLLIEVLTYLGLEVNVHKTFAAGFFRESCGLDAYAGVDVTPSYVNEIPLGSKPESIISVVESSNNFFQRGWWRTSDYLRYTLPARLRNQIGVKGVGSGAFGFLSYVGGDTSHLKMRWDVNLHHWEVLALCAVKRNRRRRIRGSAALLQYFTENPQPTTKWVSGVGLRTPLTLKRLGIPSYNYNKR